MDPNLIKIKSGRKRSIDMTENEPESEDITMESSKDFEDSKNLFEPQNIHEKLFLIIQHHKLVLSQTAGVNLMMVPENIIALIETNISLAKMDSELCKDVATVAEIEHTFLRVKNELFRESATDLQLFLHQDPVPSVLFMRIQVMIITNQWNCAHTNCCKTHLRINN